MKNKTEYILGKPEYLGAFTKRTELTTISPTFWRRLLKPIGWKIIKIGDIKTVKVGNTIRATREMSYRRVTFLENLWETIKYIFRR